jgi:Gpi18-like mannosyltransferase
MRTQPGNSKYLTSALIILLVSLTVRLYLIPLPGHFVDMGHFVRWTKAATEEGIAFVYAIASPDYPPGIFYILKPIGIIYQKFISPDFEDTMLLRMLLKLPAVTADLATAMMIFFSLRKWKSEKIAFWAMTFYALNPAIIYVSAYWGQLDAINTFFMFAAIILLNIM